MRKVKNFCIQFFQQPFHVPNSKNRTRWRINIYYFHNAEQIARGPLIATVWRWQSHRLWARMWGSLVTFEARRGPRAKVWETLFFVLRDPLIYLKALTGCTLRCLLARSWPCCIDLWLWCFLSFSEHEPGTTDSMTSHNIVPSRHTAVRSRTRSPEGSTSRSHINIFFRLRVLRWKSTKHKMINRI